MSSRSFASRLLNGSSMSRRRGRIASARASATRCCWPPLSWLGYLAARSPRRTKSSAAPTSPAMREGRVAAHLQAVADILRHGHVREECIMLKHQPDVALLRRHTRDVLAVDQDGAAVDGLETGNHSERRRFPAAARAQQAHEFAIADRKRQIIDGDDIPEQFRNMTERELGHRSIYQPDMQEAFEDRESRCRRLPPRSWQSRPTWGRCSLRGRRT